MASNLCLLNVDLNENKEDVQSIFAGPCYVQNIFNICYTKHFHLLTLNVKFSQTSLLLVLKVKSYFAVRGKTERRYEHKAITFSLKENKETQHELFKWIRETSHAIDK